MSSPPSPSPSPPSHPPSPSPSLSPYPFLNPHRSHSPIAVDSVIAASSLVLFILLLALIFFLYSNHNKKSPHRDLSTSVDFSDDHYPLTSISTLHHATSSLPLTDVDIATDGFHPSLIIGKGHLGTVYRASGDPVFAFKRIHSHLVLTNAGLDFSSKLKTLAYPNHPNIVPLLGYSEAPGERIIVTEFIGNKPLDYYLRDDESAKNFDWMDRLRIAAGMARGIEHLHEGSAPGIVHGRVKPSNVLIDDNFVARICDYGLSFLDLNNYKKVMAGYVDGEGREERSKANDVYGLGVILLEILSGRRSDGGLIVDWCLPLIKGGLIEEVLDMRVALPEDLKPLVRTAKVASACVGNGRKSRPSAGQVAAILSSLEREACEHKKQGRRVGR